MDERSMTPLEKIARVLDPAAFMFGGKHQEAAFALARRVISSIEVDDAMVEAAYESPNLADRSPRHIASAIRNQ